MAKTNQRITGRRWRQWCRKTCHIAARALRASGDRKFDRLIGEANVRRGAALLIAHRRLAAKTIAVPPTLCHERASPKIGRPTNAMSISIGIRCLS
jgi:hypothetical protein